MFMEAGNLSSGMVLYLFQTEFYDYFFLLLKRPWSCSSRTWEKHTAPVRLVLQNEGCKQRHHCMSCNWCHVTLQWVLKLQLKVPQGPCTEQLTGLYRCFDNAVTTASDDAQDYACFPSWEKIWSAPRHMGKAQCSWFLTHSFPPHLHQVKSASWAVLLQHHDRIAIKGRCWTSQLLWIAAKVGTWNN